MKSNWFNLIMKVVKVEYRKKLLLKGVSIVLNKDEARLKIAGNMTIKINLLSKLVGIYSTTIVMTSTPKAVIEIGDNFNFFGATITCIFSKKIGDYRPDLLFSYVHLSTLYGGEI